MGNTSAPLGASRLSSPCRAAPAPSRQAQAACPSWRTQQGASEGAITASCMAHTGKADNSAYGRIDLPPSGVGARGVWAASRCEQHPPGSLIASVRSSNGCGGGGGLGGFGRKPAGLEVEAGRGRIIGVKVRSFSASALMRSRSSRARLREACRACPGRVRGACLPSFSPRRGRLYRERDSSEPENLGDSKISEILGISRRISGDLGGSPPRLSRERDSASSCIRGGSLERRASLAASREIRSARPASSSCICSHIGIRTSAGMGRIRKAAAALAASLSAADAARCAAASRSLASSCGQGKRGRAAEGRFGACLPLPAGTLLAGPLLHAWGDMGRYGEIWGDVGRARSSRARSSMRGGSLDWPLSTRAWLRRRGLRRRGLRRRGLRRRGLAEVRAGRGEGWPR